MWALKRGRVMRSFQKTTIGLFVLLTIGIYMYSSGGFVDQTPSMLSDRYDGSTWPPPATERTASDRCKRRLWHYVTHNVRDEAKHGKLTAEAKTNVKKMLKTLGAKCRQFLEAGQTQHSSVYSVLRRDPEQASTVTFVTQLGSERFDRLELILDTWKDAISAAVYISRADVAGFLKKLCECDRLRNRANVDIHLVFKYGNYYPLNLLRNVALNGTRSYLSYLSDVDFIPARGTEGIVKRILLDDKSYFDRKVLVIPAFEMLKNSTQIPQSKNELIHLLNKGVIIPARQKKWPKGHMPTNYDKWRETTDIYSIDYTEDYEPYIVMKTSDVPQYSQLFVERYKDKASHLLEVWAKGFRYHVLGLSYTVHYPHSRSQLSTSDNLYRCALATNGIFHQQIMKRYNISSIPQY